MEPLALPPVLDLPGDLRARLDQLYISGVLKDSAVSIPDLIANEFSLDIRARYGTLEIAHPIGKGSGQLSLQRRQVEEDANAGLAFVVLKTVIAEDEEGSASMEAWKVKKPRMVVERIHGKRVERAGWTVSWAGRGWEGSLESYLSFMSEALRVGAERSMPVIPSCKYNLPSEEQTGFLTNEYRYTTQRFDEVWRGVHPKESLVLEQDFSPTLAGTDAAHSKRLILKWLRESPALIRRNAPGIILGVKLMNALFEDEFQLAMIEALSREARPEGNGADFLVCFNRLFDPDRPFGDKKGIAYGGPDLSDRNFAIMRRAREEERLKPGLPISASGDITSGSMMIEYALRGATSGQVHTFFQLPMDHFSLKGVTRTRAALHELYFHPTEGIVAAMCHLRHRELGHRESFSFMGLPGLGSEILTRKPSSIS